MIKIYDAKENIFEHNGLGVLRDALSCIVTEEDNGEYELELLYTNGSLGSEYLKVGNIIKAKANHIHQDQLFRIYEVENDIDENIKVLARHITYDLRENFVENVNALNKTCSEAFKELLDKATISHKFTGYSDIEHTGNFSMARSNILECIKGKRGSLCDTYGNGPKLIRDNFHIDLLKERGIDNNVIISYTKNLTGYTRTINEEDVVTVIYPFAHYKEDESLEELIVLPERFVYSDNVNLFHEKKILSVDFSEDEVSDIATLRSLANSYFRTTKKDIPKINYKVEFIELSKTLEYMDLGLYDLEKINLGDTVTIKDSRINLDIQATVIKTIFDSITNTYISIELGNFKDSLNNVIFDINSNIDSQIDRVNKNILVNFEILDDKIVSQIKDLDKSLTSTIEQTAGAIRLEVKDLESNLTSSIEQTAGDIRLEVKDIASGLSSSIAQNATDIALKADKITLNGYVTFNALEGSGQTTINGSNITTGTIDANVVRVTNLNANNITSGTINGNKISVTNISGSNITTGTIDASKITVSNLSASNITSGTIDANKITVSNLNANNITSGTIDANKITVSNLNANNITSGTIDANKITVSNLNANNITSGTIDASKITVSNLSASNITSGTINGNNITVSNLNADNIKTGTINGQSVTMSNLNGSNITSGTIDASKITVSNIDADNIKAGTISGNFIKGGIIEGSLFKTAERTSNSGVEITRNALYLGHTGFLYQDTRFKIETVGNFSMSSTSDIYLMPGMVGATATGNGSVNVSGALKCTKLFLNGAEFNGAARFG
ncbi:MAG: phage tail spike protein [Peptostreptococcaceae bacterium]